MKIKITTGVRNLQFEHRKKRYLLECGPVMVSPTLGEINKGARDGFVYARISLLEIATRPLRIKKEYHLSDIFYDGAKYKSAVTGGFEVLLDAQSAARLLVKAGLAERV